MIDDYLFEAGLADANLFLLAAPILSSALQPFIPQDKVSSSGWPADWNDDPSRTKEEVIALLEKVARG